MKRLITLIISTLTLLTIMVACGSSTSTVGDEAEKNTSDESITLRMGGVDSPQMATSKASERFVEIVDERTNGEIEIEFFPAEQLGDGSTQVDNLKSGLQDIFISDIGFFNGYQRDFNILGMPYLFEDADHFQRVLDSSVFEEMEEKLLTEHDMVVLANNFARLPRIMVSTEPIETTDDVEGMRIRVPEIPIFVKHAESLSASPTPTAWGEVYMGYQQGIIDAGFPTKDTIYSSNFHEVAPYIIDLEHSFSTSLAVIGEEVFEKLSSEQQEILRESANEAGLYQKELIEEDWEEQKNLLIEEGATFLEPNPEPFKDIVLPAAEELEQEGLWGKGLLEKVRSVE